MRAAYNIFTLLLLVVNCCNGKDIAERQIQQKWNEEMQKCKINIENGKREYNNYFGNYAATNENTVGNYIYSIQTSLKIINSSLCVTHLNIIPLSTCPLLTSQQHSAATICSSTCQVNPATKSPLFLSGHASVDLTNFSLTTHQPAIFSFPLFSTPNNLLTDAHSSIPASFSISHSSFSSFVSLVQPFLFSPSSLSSPSPSPSPSLSSSPSSFSSLSSSSSFSSPSPSISSFSSPSPFHIHHQSYHHLKIHLNLHLSNTLFSNISSPQSHPSLPSLPSHSLNSFISTTSSSSSTSTNTNTNLIHSFSLRSSLSIHSTIFLHTNNPIDGAILPNLNSPSTSLSAFNASFLHQTRSSPNDLAKYIGSETQREKLRRLSFAELNSYIFKWCEWNESNSGDDWGGALKVNCTNANLTITSCSFFNCSTSNHAGALFCGYLLKIDITKSNFTNCSAFHGGATCIAYPQSNSVWTFSDNRVKNCKITSCVGTGWYFYIGNFSSNGQFLFNKCKCIANSGGHADGSLTFYNPPKEKPIQFLVDDCLFVNNELTSSSTTYGGAGLCCTATYSWMNGVKFITFCFFDGNIAKNGRGNDVFFNGSSITQSPFENCGSTTQTKRVWNNGTADNAVYNGWLPIINQNKIVANGGSDVDACGKTQQSPCATIEYSLRCIAPFSDASLSLLISTFAPTKTLTFRAPNTKITGNGTDATTIASSGIPQPSNSHSQSSQSTSSTSTSSSPDPSASSALFQQTQGSLTVSALAIAHNSSNQITPILFHLSNDSPSLNLNTTTITGTTSITIKTPLFFLTAGSLALNHTAITSLTLNSQSIFHLTSLTAPLTLNSSSITDITSTATPASCVLSSATSPALSLSLTNCTITNINSEQLSQQTATNGGCISFASSVSDNTFSVSSTTFTGCCVNEDASDGGKGGGIYLDCSSNEGGFQLSSISFSGCRATVGKNMFVKSGNLVASVKTERFAFDYSDYEDDGNAFVGEDEKYGELDLRVFLVSLKWVEVSVSTDGHDTLGCGDEIFPCESTKSGIDHIDRSGTEGERKVKVKDEGTIEDIYLFTNALVIDGCVNEGDETKHRPIHFKGTIKGNSELTSSVISSTVSLDLLSLKLQIPSQFEPNMNTLISSSNNLQLENCLFEIQSSTAIQYSLISTTSGSCTLKGCSLADCSFIKSSFVIASSVLFENSNFSNIMNTGSGEEGGISKVILKNEEDLIIKSTNASFCSLSSGKGKGGFLYFDCQSCSKEKPFLFDTGVIFENNNAAIGKNMYILAKDFNTSITNESFKFDYLSMINDNCLFVGSDNFHSNKDLFMFLVPYSSTEIFISSSGFDVARCGSEEEPCFTMWKGMMNMKREIGMKAIQIEGSTFIRDSYDVSNYQIKKSVKMGEENVKAILNFEKSIGSQLDHYMENDGQLELTNIQLQLTSGFDNSAKTIISNKGGDLVITGCSFHSEAGVNNGFECVFVDAIGGTVEVNDLSMDSCNVGNSIFVIHDVGVDCHLMNVRVESLNESGGCLLIKGSESTTKINKVGEEMSLNIDNSSFSGVKRSDNGASILESMSEKKICLVVNSSNITEDKAEDSEKGGAIFFALGLSGSMKMIDSTISQCSCTIGKGGGVYLTTKEKGDLNFSFAKMKFNANTARVGNDIFIECFNITFQINETQFQFDLRENRYSRINAIYGIDKCQYTVDTDLIGFITIHQSDTIIVSSASGLDYRQCGTNDLPCYSIDYGLMHLTSDIMSLIFVVEESVICEEINLEEMSLSSKKRENCEVEVKSEITSEKNSLISTAGTVSLLRVNFVFDSNFISSHDSLISPEGGILEIMNCSFTTKQLTEGENVVFANVPFHIFNMAKGELQLMECSMSNLILQESALYLSSQLPSVIDSLTICNSTIKTSLININECGQLTIKDFKTENITVEGNEESLISCLSLRKTIHLANCTIGGVSSKTTKGKLMKVENCLDVKMDSCIFDGSLKERNEKNLNAKEEEMCKWDGSLVDVVKSSVVMKDTTITNSSEGGITMSGGSVIIEMGLFENNNPSIEGYTSLRRNIICSNSGSLNVMSLKGGDGWKDNTSLWMLNEGCSFEGIASERDSSFFIPVLESVEAKEEADRMKLTFKGLLLVPCNLSFSVVKRKGEEKEIEKHDFDSNGFLSEREVEGSVTKDLISNCGDEIEVSVSVLFGNAESPSSTNSFILKNASDPKLKGDERISEGGNQASLLWIVIAIILIVLLIVLIIAVAFIVRWKKQKRRSEELEEIVNDTVKKDPKLIEMVTMEMSPEEQWRRAEREAEKKNEERIKKRVYAKSLGHSESSEHLLSESDSTEYILGRDSDKIPDWALEKVEEEKEEETRKRTPSPSISSTSTTDTSDTESTFVRGEDLCPTTSSMSNLVDAMACSSPHEKLIVDLRDSLFMLLHESNKIKEMPIGSLKEREQTAAQILFWVANGALHSFDEMENPLQSLANLSPHIVLFSEHMVICIVMHSDLLQDDDSDSSSISSSTIVTSASDDDDDDSLPSSAFEEDEDAFRKECLRWKAPELQVTRKMGATKESVSFSIGMMLWECVTLEIPFGEYPAEVAGEKIGMFEMPNMAGAEGSSLWSVVKGCVEQEASRRITLVEVKRELISHFPKDALVMTMSDAVEVVETRREEGDEKEGKKGKEGECN
ncbi:uncharacterized protein MONOS_9677 [Monocercomonoides exilis]|uniref:uncharacterized protein n=1 Tax=Monocercomonoides exilis TaxID=2049356 RepID=UPI0035598912|nr:hypothetical protein MONOS_9677 [Monocercomonoides exilis]